jgi:hypothetical protein
VNAAVRRQDDRVHIGGEFAGPALLRSQTSTVGVTVHLVIEVDDIEVDGRTVDGYRTWVGRITAGAVDTAELTSQWDLRIELPSGRYAACVVLDDLRIVGLGAPPFD